MKSLNLQEVVADIDVRMILFDKLRIVKNTDEANVNLKKTKDNEIVNKNIDNEVLGQEKINNNEILIDNDKKETIVNEKSIDSEIAIKNAKLSIVTDELINQDNFIKKELSEIDMAKLANFKKNDDFFFDEVAKEVETPKKGTPNFFKALSGFFNDITKDQNVQDKSKSDIKLKPQRNEVAAETAKSYSKQEKDQSQTDIVLETPQPIIEPEKSQKEIDDEKAIKAEKLRLIEEEYRLKAEKREADEKLIADQQEAETAKSNADFRKNKRKK